MVETVLFPPITAQPDRDDAKPAPRPPPRGPVLMGDIMTVYGGRPALLLHWDQDED